MKIKLGKILGAAKKALPVVAAVLNLAGKGSTAKAIEKIDDATS